MVKEIDIEDTYSLCLSSVESIQQKGGGKARIL